MKLVFIITSLTVGGAESMLLKLLQKLDRARFSPQVITLRTKGDLGPCIEALGIPVHALGMSPGFPDPMKLLRLVKLLRDIQPDAVSTWLYHADLLGGLAAKLARIRSVAWSIHHSNLSPRQNKRFTLMVMRTCALLSSWLPSAIVTCSERARSAHVAAGYRADRMVLIPNGFDLERFVPDSASRDSVRVELGVPLEAPLVGLIARDDPQKNHGGFVEAAKYVHQLFPLTHFVLAGTGIDQHNVRLVRLISEAGLEKHMHLLGQRDDIPRLMASLDVLASPSHGEAFPNVLGEAMACAVPCVVTDAGDSADIVGDTGRVVACEDMSGLAQHIVEVLQMPAEQRFALGGRARERVQSRYEIGHVVRRYEAFYTNLLKGVA